MASNISISKVQTGFVPTDNESWEIHSKMKYGEVFRASFKKMRNAGFHRKFFALLNLAYEYWEPGEINSKYGVPQKNFERFRKDLIILSGHYDVAIRIDGTTRVEAKSISFGSMDQEEFEKLYSSVLDQVLKRINVLSSLGKEEINRLVNEMIGFS